MATASDYDPVTRTYACGKCGVRGKPVAPFKGVRLCQTCHPAAEPAPAEHRVADRFAAILREWLTPRQFEVVRRRNAKETHPNVCHSHDFCDANEAMLAAIREVLNIEMPNDIEGTEFQRVWIAAWDRAKLVHLTKVPQTSRRFCACGELRDDFGACWKCDAPKPDAAAPVALCPRCTDEEACADHEVR